MNLVLGVYFTTRTYGHGVIYTLEFSSTGTKGSFFEVFERYEWLGKWHSGVRRTSRLHNTAISGSPVRGLSSPIVTNEGSVSDRNGRKYLMPGFFYFLGTENLEHNCDLSIPKTWQLRPHDKRTKRHLRSTIGNNFCPTILRRRDVLFIPFFSSSFFFPP